MSRLELADTWSAELPAGWVAERDGDTVATTHPDAAGTLHLTELRAPSPLTETRLREIALARHGSDPESLQTEVRGDFEGLGLCHRRDQNHVYELYLARGRDLIFATYVCDQGEEELDAAAVAAILDSLQSARPAG